jgi:hypothetical protein
MIFHLLTGGPDFDEEKLDGILPHSSLFKILQTIQNACHGGRNMVM